MSNNSQPRIMTLPERLRPCGKRALVIGLALLLASCQGMAFHPSTKELTMSKDTKTYCLGRGSLTLPADLGLLVYEPYLDYRGTFIEIKGVVYDTTFKALAQQAENMKQDFQRSLQPYADGKAHYVLLVEQKGTLAMGEWWFGYQATQNSKDEFIYGYGYILLPDRLITFKHLPDLTHPFPANEADRRALGDYMKGLIDSHHLLEPGQAPPEPALCYGNGYFTGAAEATETFGGGLALLFRNGSRAGPDVKVAWHKEYHYDSKASPLVRFPQQEIEARSYGISMNPMVMGHRTVDGMDGEERVTAKILPDGRWSQDYIWLFFGQLPDKPYTVFRDEIQKQEEVLAEDTAWDLVLNGWRTHR